jgi:hypothetical protein
MIPLVIQTKEPIENLDIVRGQQQREGGRIVHYRDVRSYLVMSKSKPILRWVAEGRSPSLEGLKASRSTLLFGWWSLPGLIDTIESLTHNVCGGVDVTQLYGQSAPAPDSSEHLAAVRQIKNRSRVLSALGLFAVLMFFAGIWRCLYLIYMANQTA